MWNAESNAIAEYDYRAPKFTAVIREIGFVSWKYANSQWKKMSAEFKETLASKFWSRDALILRKNSKNREKNNVETKRDRKRVYICGIMELRKIRFTKFSACSREYAFFTSIRSSSSWTRRVIFTRCFIFHFGRNIIMYS